MASAEYSVLTPERVSLKYDIAGIGSRGAAAVVDTALQFAAMGVIGVALTSSYVTTAAFLPFLGGEGAGTLLVGLFVFGVLLVTGGYFMLFEIVWSGQTPGKRLVGLRVIRESGYPMRPVDGVIRNLVRIVDWLPGMYGIGVLTMLLNKRAKRLGDFASGTIVVREGSRGTDVGLTSPSADGLVSADGELPAQRSYTLSNADATLVRDFLLRRASMDKDARAAFAQRLAAALAHRYSLPLEQAPESFLEHLAN
jgi:uncharacterized RDD family membrane protein YckC